MKSLIETRQFNGIQGDPGSLVFFPRSGDSVLFDLGNTDHLSHKDLLRVTHVFVTHTHMDHFIGFDRLLRVNVPHARTIKMYGPPGFIENVRGRLSSYLWNLLTPGQLRFDVHELDRDGNVRAATLVNNDFQPTPIAIDPPAITKADAPLPARPASWLATLGDGTRVEGVVLDHGTPSIAFVLQAPCRYHVNEEQLVAQKLIPGPWVRDLQIAMSDQDHERTINTGDRQWRAAELGALLLTSSAPRLLAYITDIGFTRDNIERLRPVMRGAESLLCEATFRDADRGEARAKMHLTTRQTALIAATTQARSARIFHVSNLYTGAIPEVLAEFHGFTREYQAMTPADLDAALENEFRLVSAIG